MLLVIVMIAVGSVFLDRPDPANAPRTLRYSDFVEAVQANEISRVLISPDRGTAQVVKNSGQRAVVNLEPDKDLLKILTDHNVDIAVQPSRELADWQQVVGSIFFPLLLLAGLFFLLRRGQGGGGNPAMSFGLQQREMNLVSAGVGRKITMAPDDIKLNPVAKLILGKRGINIEPFPSPDQLVVMFLRQHDVDVCPPSGTRAGDALSGAFFGAVGPAASFAGSHLRQQEKIAAVQEWTSWKQWALGHADWPAFKESIKQQYNANQKIIHEVVNSVDFQADCDDYMVRDKKERQEGSKAIKIAALTLSIAFLFSLVISTYGKNSKDQRFISAPEYSSPGF